MMTDTDYMKMALVEAQKAFDEDEVPIGAVIVCKGRVVARAHNLTEMLNDVTAHAEMQAITAAASNIGGKYLTDCTDGQGSVWCRGRETRLSPLCAQCDAPKNRSGERCVCR